MYPGNCAFQLRTSSAVIVAASEQPARRSGSRTRRLRLVLSTLSQHRPGKEITMAKLNSLDDLLVHELQDIYNAETQILKALPKMIKAASHPELQSAFEEHLEQTEGQVERLDQVFKLLGVPAKGKKCEGMAGLIEEGKKVMEEDANPSVMDAALIASAQKVEHYEIASYGCVCTYAEMLGYDQVHDLLGQNLEEEEVTDEKLSELAESVINIEAEAAEDAEEEASR